MNGDILLVDDDPGIAQIMSRMLSGLANTRYACDAREAIDQVKRGVPDLILLDAEMPDMHGLDLCRVLKAEASFRDMPIIFVTAHTEQEFEVRALEAGACDFISKPVHEPLLRARVRTQLQIKQLTDDLREQAMSDGLTGLANRRNFDSMIAREWRRGIRNGDPISLLLIDVDHFKAYNDHYGHPAGDECLRQIASIMSGAVRRPCDLVARYGGEEFVALLPQTDREGAQIIAQRILDAVNDLALPHARSTSADHVTVSIGIAAYDQECPGWQETGNWGRRSPAMQLGPVDLLESADRAMYMAKQAGRAQIRARGCNQHTRNRRSPPAPMEPERPRRAPPVLSKASVIIGEKQAEWPHIAGIDWEQSRQRLAGNLELFGTMLRRLVDEFETLEAESIEQDSEVEITARLHKLKGSAGTLGAVDLQQLAARAEQAMRSGDKPVAGDLVTQVHAQLVLIRDECSHALVN